VRRVIVALALVSSLVAPPAFAERCTKYVDIVTPCAGLAGPTARVIAGRAAVPALDKCTAKLTAANKLRTIDARAAAARIASLERMLAAKPDSVATPAQVLPPPPARASPALWFGAGFASAAVVAIALALTLAPG
jgi:hypothetical protein